MNDIYGPGADDYGRDKWRETEFRKELNMIIKPWTGVVKSNIAMRAKFRCNSVTDFGGQKQAQLNAVYSKEGENADFAKATPCGDLKINIDSGVPASDFFTPSKEYYLDFTLAE